MQGMDAKSAPGGSPPLNAAPVDGHDDHRVVMVLVVVGLGCDKTLSIEGSDAVEPVKNFVQLRFSHILQSITIFQHETLHSWSPVP